MVRATLGAHHTLDRSIPRTAVITKKRTEDILLETLAINPESSNVDVNRGQMVASEGSSRNRIAVIIVPTIGLAGILYYSGLLEDITYQIEALMYFILNDIPRSIMNTLGL